MIKWTKEFTNKCIEELGFDMPSNEEELKLWNNKFKDYPYELTGEELDPNKIWDGVLYPYADELEKEQMKEDILRSPIFIKK